MKWNRGRTYVCISVYICVVELSKDRVCIYALHIHPCMQFAPRSLQGRSKFLIDIYIQTCTYINIYIAAHCHVCACVPVLCESFP